MGVPFWADDFRILFFSSGSIITSLRSAEQQLNCLISTCRPTGPNRTDRNGERNRGFPDPIVHRLRLQDVAAVLIAPSWQAEVRCGGTGR